MSFGLPNAPSCMSTLISMVVSGLPGTVAYLDDILVGDKTIEDCRNNLEKFFQRLAEKKNLQLLQKNVCSLKVQ